MRPRCLTVLAVALLLGVGKGFAVPLPAEFEITPKDGKLLVEGTAFKAEAAGVKLDRQKQLLTLTGSKKEPAVVYVGDGTGLPPKRYSAVRIIVNLADQSMNLEGAGELR